MMSSQNEDKIRDLIEKRIKAVKSQHINEAVINCDSGLLTFDVVGELASTGVEAAKERLKKWFSSMKELIDFDMKIINIEAGDAVACCHSFNHIRAIKEGGGKLDMWWRETLGIKKINNEWTITSAHSSVPFDGETGKASTHLQPSGNI